MIVSNILELSGVFSRIGAYLSNKEISERLFMISYILLVSISASLVMNDTSLVIFIPFIIAISKSIDIDVKKSIVITCIAANLGSSLTPFGNPQNIIIWRYYEIPMWKFILYTIPIYILGFILLSIATFLHYRSKNIIKVKKGRPLIKLNTKYLSLSILLLLLDILTIDLGYYWIGLVITILSVSILNIRLILKLDYILIAIFILMFIVFGEISLYLNPLSSIIPHNSILIFLYSIVISQLISNVPATIILVKHVYNWIPLLWGVNIGGVGMITSSMANIIVLRLSNISLKTFHKYQIPYFILLLIISAVLLNSIL